jgi:hypothetical protein
MNKISERPEWAWRSYVAVSGGNEVVVARVWNDRPVPFITLGDGQLDLATGELDQSARAIIEAARDTTLQSQLQWYVQELGVDRYKIALVWSRKAAEAVIVDEASLELAVDEAREMIAFFVRERLPRP